MVQTLEEAAIEGHTLLPASWIVQRIRERPMKPECPLDSDTLSVVEDALASLIIKVPMSDDIHAW